MIDLELIETAGFEAAVEAMRNPMNSWDKSDSAFFENNRIVIGDSDFELMQKLTNAGVEHRTFLRMIMCYVNVTAPLYWWKEMDRYTVGKVQVSCSTMHKIQAHEFSSKDFSCEHINGVEATRALMSTINALNRAREDFMRSNDKKHWWNMIQLLPDSYMQKRTLCLSYEVLSKIYKERKNHKLDEWHEFCKFIESLPLTELWTKQATDGKYEED